MMEALRELIVEDAPFYLALGGFLLGVNAMPIPWKTILFSVAIYVGLPLVAGYFSRKLIIKFPIQNDGVIANEAR